MNNSSFVVSTRAILSTIGVSLLLMLPALGNNSPRIIFGLLAVSAALIFAGKGFSFQRTNRWRYEYDYRNGIGERGLHDALLSPDGYRHGECRIKSPQSRLMQMSAMLTEIIERGRNGKVLLHSVELHEMRY